ncbi:MAG: RHS repeat-associated core domain-containing protein [Bacteroidota bacterium]
MAFADLNDNGRIDLADPASGEVTQVNNYYPFGMVHPENCAPDGVVGNDNQFRFNGIEHLDKVGIDLAPFRGYDAAVGRWLHVDPIYKFHESGYAAMANNPVLLADPMGLDTIGPTPQVLPTVTVTACGPDECGGQQETSYSFYGFPDPIITQDLGARRTEADALFGNQGRNNLSLTSTDWYTSGLIWSGVTISTIRSANRGADIVLNSIPPLTYRAAIAWDNLRGIYKYDYPHAPIKYPFIPERVRSGPPIWTAHYLETQYGIKRVPSTYTHPYVKGLSSVTRNLGPFLLYGGIGMDFTNTFFSENLSFSSVLGFGARTGVAYWASKNAYVFVGSIYFNTMFKWYTSQRYIESLDIPAPLSALRFF